MTIPEITERDAKKARILAFDLIGSIESAVAAKLPEARVRAFRGNALRSAAADDMAQVRAWCIQIAKEAGL